MQNAPSRRAGVRQGSRLQLQLILQEQAVTRATQNLQDATEKRNDELMKELAAKQAMLLDAVNRINSLIAEQIASDGTASSCSSSQRFPRQANSDGPSTACDCLQARERARKQIGCSNSKAKYPNKRIAWMLQQHKLMLLMPR
jgi:hypothetical protein